MFSVNRSESRSSSRVRGSRSTFSRIVPKRLRRLEDVRLVHRRQADRLGVAAALEVEDVAVAPAVLVVADEAAQRVGRQGRLAGPATGRRRSTESPSCADVDRRVHRQDALVGHQVVHDREGGLLDLAGVLGADDDDLHPLEVDAGSPSRSGCPRSPGRPGTTGTSMIVKFGTKPASCSRGRPAEQVAGEDARPGRLGVDAQRSGGASGAAPMKQSWAYRSLVGDVVDEAGAEPVVVLLADRAVDRRPTRPCRGSSGSSTMNLSSGERPVCLPVRTTSGPSAAIDALAGADGVLVQLGGGQVGADGPTEARATGRSRCGSGSW